MATKLFDRMILSQAQEAMAFMANVFESSTGYCIIAKDREAKILLCNEGARRMYGYEPEELPGKASFSILHCAEEVTRSRRKAPSTAQ